jgi:hypothetical protein
MDLLPKVYTILRKSMMPAASASSPVFAAIKVTTL